MDQSKHQKLFDLTDRVAIVTGGTRGIGRAIAEGYALSGAKVVVASRKSDACKATQEALEALGAEALGVPTHMGELPQLEMLVEKTVERFGGIDIIVNNAANALALPFGQITPEAWEKSMSVNLRGPVFLTQYALPHLERSEHASVINVSSVGAFLFSAYTHMYAAAKAGLQAYTRSLAAELEPKGIRVNAIAPGTFETDMVHNNTEEQQDGMRNAALMKRGAEADEIVGLALLLAADAGSFMTGTTVNIDGGLYPR